MTSHGLSDKTNSSTSCVVLNKRPRNPPRPSSPLPQRTATICSLFTSHVLLNSDLSKLHLVQYHDLPQLERRGKHIHQLWVQRQPTLSDSFQRQSVQLSLGFAPAREDVDCHEIRNLYSKIQQFFLADLKNEVRNNCFGCTGRFLNKIPLTFRKSALNWICLLFGCKNIDWNLT